VNKLVFTGPTQYLGQYHFTRGKIYDVYSYSITTNYIVADNDIRAFFYKSIINSEVFFIDKEMSLQDITKLDRNFITLDKWRELQINKILTYE
jgi:hypothetical protein